MHFQLPMELSVVFTNPQNLSDKTGTGLFRENIGFTPRNVHPIWKLINVVSTELIVFLNDISASPFF